MVLYEYSRQYLVAIILTSLVLVSAQSNEPDYSRQPRPYHTDMNIIQEAAMPHHINVELAFHQNYGDISSAIYNAANSKWLWV